MSHIRQLAKGQRYISDYGFEVERSITDSSESPHLWCAEYFPGVPVEEEPALPPGTRKA